MAAPDIDCEISINEVLKRPLMWNTACENYKEKTKKKTAWSEITISFISDFQDKNVSEQK